MSRRAPAGAAVVVIEHGAVVLPENAPAAPASAASPESHEGPTLPGSRFTGRDRASVVAAAAEWFALSECDLVVRAACLYMSRVRA